MKKRIVGYAIVYMHFDYEFAQGPDNDSDRGLDFLHNSLDGTKPVLALYQTRKAAREAINRTHAYKVAHYEHHIDERKHFKIVPVMQHGKWKE